MSATKMSNWKRQRLGEELLDTTKFLKNSGLDTGLGDGRRGYKGHLGNN